MHYTSKLESNCVRRAGGSDGTAADHPFGRRKDRRVRQERGSPAGRSVHNRQQLAPPSENVEDDIGGMGALRHGLSAGSFDGGQAALRD
jgi:hypothetical protein